MAARFIPPRVPLVDPRTGLVTREWYLFFQGLFSAETGIPDDMMASIAPAGVDDAVFTALASARDDANLAPPPVTFATLAALAIDDTPDIGALRDEIAMLRRRVDDLSKGTIL